MQRQGPLAQLTYGLVQMTCSSNQIKIPFRGPFLYTPSMPAVILTNIGILHGLFNSAAEPAVGIVIDLASE
jgi:hypothetical protein